MSPKLKLVDNQQIILGIAVIGATTAGEVPLPQGEELLAIAQAAKCISFLTPCRAASNMLLCRSDTTCGALLDFRRTRERIIRELGVVC